MVYEWNKILDGNKKKICADAKMGRDETIEMDCAINELVRKWMPDKKIWDDTTESYTIKKGERNENYKEPTPIIDEWEGLQKRAILLCEDIGHGKVYDVKRELRQDMLDDPNKKRALYRFIGKTPFQTCVMINISPDWKGKIDPRNKRYQQLLKETVKRYLTSCNRFTRYQFCLESGSNGDFLHAHIVAEINPAMEKTMMTQINKGNYKRSLIKFWKQVNLEMGIEGIGGILEGKYSVQRIIIRNETMRDDKIAYLREENKPDDHKNLFNLNRVIGDFNLLLNESP